MNHAGGFYRDKGNWMNPKPSYTLVTYAPIVAALDRLEELEKDWEYMTRHKGLTEELQSRIDRALEKLLACCSPPGSAIDNTIAILRGDDKPKTVREQLEGKDYHESQDIMAIAIDALRADLDRRE